MKHRVFLLILVCLLVLSGCSCKHEWQEADCLNASVCTKCEEIQGEALGHDWQPAACEAPEICSRCGQTQGEALGHSYGKWIIGETDMTRTCENCPQQETAEIDREIALRQLLEGNWDFAYSMKDNKMEGHSAYLADGKAIAALFVSPEGACTFYNGQQYYDGTVELVEYQTPDDTVEQYTFLVNLDGESINFALLQTGDEVGMAMYLSQNHFFVLSKSTELEAALTGNWAAAGNNQFFSITLAEDRTFTAELEESVSGHWFLVPIYTSGNYRYSKLILIWETDGTPQGCSFSLSLGSTERPLEETLQYSLSFSANIGGSYRNFSKASEENAAAMKEAALSGGKNIVGQWTSRRITTYDFNAGKSSDRNTTEYAITFAEDGTFTAVLDMDRKGTWEFDQAQTYSGNDYVDYRYKLKFDGVSQVVYATIGYNDELSFHHSDENLSKSIYFAVMSAERKAKEEKANAEAAGLLAGNWNSLFTTTYDPDTQHSDRVVTTGYSLNILKDGTFTAHMDEEITGTWEVQQVDVNEEYNYTAYSYSLYSTENNEQYSLYLNPSGQLSMYYNDKNLVLSQITDAQVKEFEKGPGLITGTWTGKQSYTYDADSEQDIPHEKGDFSVTVNADGTYTAQLGNKLENRWEYYDYDPEYGYQYMFYYEDNYSQIFCIRDDGRLEAGFRENEEYVYTYLEKN